MGTSLALRRGLPRVPGGEPWPPPGVVEVDDRPDFLAQTAIDVPAVARTDAATTDAATTDAAAPDERVAVEQVTEPAAQPGTEPAAAVVRSVPLRRGLPRTPGGEAWPAAGTGQLTTAGEAFDLALRAASAPAASATSTVSPAPAAEGGPAPAAAASPAPAVETPVPAAPVATTTTRVPLRRGLPRTAGGEGWPPAGEGVRVVAAEAFSFEAPASPQASPAQAPTPAAPAPAAGQAVGAAGDTRTEQVPLRRGLPRRTGGEPWPAAGFGALTVLVPGEPEPSAVPEPSPAASEPTPAPPADPAERTPVAAPPVEPAPPVAAPPVAAPAVAPQPGPTRAPARPAVAAAVAAKPAAARAGSAAPATSAPARTPVLASAVALVRRFPAVAVVVAIALVGAGMALAGWFTQTSAGTAFLARFPGSYALPAGADPGFPAWARWNHFLNLFFIVLIVRSGLGVRYEKKPPAYWTPKTPKLGGKISLTLWLHQTLDVLWLLNGFAFLVLLFATDHWMRIVPTSWEVFPNAVSAALQYVTFDWPAEAGWTNYNSLQQLAYFTVVFVAAPVAALTGVRMSGLWPTSARRLSALYPVEVARAVHFPTMIFFVVFVIGHVSMVFLTGARANLNHMFAGQNSGSWAGFWVFVGAMAVLAVAWELVRPALLAPLANLLGRVSQR